MGNLIKAIGPVIVIRAASVYDPPRVGNHQRPHQTPRSTPLDNGPKHGGLVRRGNRLPKASINRRRPENQR